MLFRRSLTPRFARPLDAAGLALSRHCGLRSPLQHRAASHGHGASNTDSEDDKSTQDKFRLFFRLKDSDDPTVLLAGQVASKQEYKLWNEYEQKMSMAQYITSLKIRGMLAVRHSFVHGGMRRALTVMAVYAAGAEFLHDFFHHYHSVQ